MEAADGRAAIFADAVVSDTIPGDLFTDGAMSVEDTQQAMHEHGTFLPVAENYVELLTTLQVRNKVAWLFATRRESATAQSNGALPTLVRSS